MIDQISIDRIKKLHPKLVIDAQDIITSLDKRGVTIRITQGLRTISEQDALYSIGRSIQGKVVTNAKGGQSYHNYGLAIDFCLLKKDGGVSFNIKDDLDQDGQADWMEVVEEFAKKGWTWGGTWKFADTPHFEKTFGYNFHQLLQMITDKKTDVNGYVLI